METASPKIEAWIAAGGFNQHICDQLLAGSLQTGITKPYIHRSFDVKTTVKTQDKVEWSTALICDVGRPWNVMLFVHGIPFAFLALS